MTKPFGRVRRFSSDDRGAIAIVFGISLLGVAFATGLAFDTARIYSAASKIQSALDAAALVGAQVQAREGSTFADVKKAAQVFFDDRINSLRVSEVSVSKAEVAANPADGSVVLSSNVAIGTTFGKLANLMPSLSFTPSSTAVFKARRVEAALVLDITGSMDMPSDKIQGLKTAAKDFVDNLFATNPEAGMVKVSLVPYSASVNLGPYFGSATSAFHSDTCVVERDGPDAYTDAPPTAGSFDYTSTATYPWYSCPSTPIEPLTDLSNSTARQSFKDRIDAMSPMGGTAGHIGTAWGWFTVSPQWASFWPGTGAPRPYSPDVIKAVIVMTDGMFNSAYRNGGGALGYGNADPSTPGSAAYQALQICNSIRNATGDPNSQIRIYTVAFQAPSEAESLLKSCGGASNFFNADDQSQLLGAFRQIVEKLTNLRISS